MTSCVKTFWHSIILYLIATTSILSSSPSAGWLESHNFQTSIRFQQRNKETQTEREREVEGVSGKWERHSHMSVYSQCSNIKPLLSVVPPQNTSNLSSFSATLKVTCWLREQSVTSTLFFTAEFTLKKHDIAGRKWNNKKNSVSSCQTYHLKKCHS